MIIKTKVQVFEYELFNTDIDARKSNKYITKGIVVPQIESYTLKDFRYYETDNNINTSKYLNIEYENRIDEIHFESIEKCDAFVEELEKCIKEVWSNPNMFIRKV